MELLLALLVVLRRREDPLDDALASWGLTFLQRVSQTCDVVKSRLMPWKKALRNKNAVLAVVYELQD